MKYDKKPLSYNWGHLNNSEEPLKSIYFEMYVINELLGYFEGKDAKGDTYGYHLITNSLLICYQSLEKAIHAKNYNILKILYRQTSDLRYNIELLFNEIERNDLAKHRIKERLKSYAAFCLWKRLNELEEMMDKDAHYFEDGTSYFSEEVIDGFTKEQSAEFHLLKDQINQLILSNQVSHFDKRRREGANLYTFSEVIDAKFKSTSSYIRQTSLPFEKQLYSIASDRIHGTWLSSEVNLSNQILCEQLNYTKDDFESVIDFVHTNLSSSMISLGSTFEFLWPVHFKSANAKRFEEIIRTGR